MIRRIAAQHLDERQRQDDDVRQPEPQDCLISACVRQMSRCATNPPERPNNVISAPFLVSLPIPQSFLLLAPRPTGHPLQEFAFHRSVLDCREGRQQKHCQGGDHIGKCPCITRRGDTLRLKRLPLPGVCGNSSHSPPDRDPAWADGERVT